MKMVTVVPFLGGYVLEGLKKRASRVYGDYNEAQRAADKINKARKRYEDLGDVELNYDDIYNNFIVRGDLPKGSDLDNGGVSKGRGFQKVFMDNNWEPTSLREIRDKGLDNDMKAFLAAASINHTDAKVRAAIKQYFFVETSWLQ